MRYQIYRTLFVIFLFCEILLVTSQRMRYLGHRENAIVLTLLAAGMGIFAILAAFEKKQNNTQNRTKNWENTLLAIVAAAGVGLCAFHFYREISVIPIDIHVSDIVPTIQVMNERLLSGQYPYALIQDFGYDLSPTYLPLMWLPFVPAMVFHFDERWMAFLIWAIAVLLLVRRVYQSSLGVSANWLLITLPFFHFILIEEGTVSTYGNTVELMIAGFYMLFALQLDKIKAFLSGSPLKSGAVMAFFLSLCLLSRYSFLLWLPLCFVVVWIENRKLALSTAAWVLAFTLLIFVFPFLLKDPMVYLNGLKYYSKAAQVGWEQVGNPSPLYDGMGMAGIFRDECGGEMAHRLATLQRWQLVVSLLAVGFCGAFWWKKRAKLQHLPLFLLGSLKLYFAFFYGFIQMPYTYLMLTPVFFSIVVLYSFYRESNLSGG